MKGCVLCGNRHAQSQYFWNLRKCIWTFCKKPSRLHYGSPLILFPTVHYNEIKFIIGKGHNNEIISVFTRHNTRYNDLVHFITLP